MDRAVFSPRFLWASSSGTGVGGSGSPSTTVSYHRRVTMKSAIHTMSRRLQEAGLERGKHMKELVKQWKANVERVLWCLFILFRLGLDDPSASYDPKPSQFSTPLAAVRIAESPQLLPPGGVAGQITHGGERVGGQIENLRWLSRVAGTQSKYEEKRNSLRKNTIAYAVVRHPPAAFAIAIQDGDDNDDDEEEDLVTMLRKPNTSRKEFWNHLLFWHEDRIKAVPYSTSKGEMVPSAEKEMVVLFGIHYFLHPSLVPLSFLLSGHLTHRDLLMGVLRTSARTERRRISTASFGMWNLRLLVFLVHFGLPVQFT